uniref:Uncharacterized protein n=1 Tax=Arundo donax TaxID=35708 RepID=A0A0A8ZEW4_ARUDO
MIVAYPRQLDRQFLLWC